MRGYSSSVQEGSLDAGGLLSMIITMSLGLVPSVLTSQQTSHASAIHGIATQPTPTVKETTCVVTVLRPYCSDTPIRMDRYISDTEKTEHPYVIGSKPTSSSIPF